MVMSETGKHCWHDGLQFRPEDALTSCCFCGRPRHYLEVPAGHGPYAPKRWADRDNEPCESTFVPEKTKGLVAPPRLSIRQAHDVDVI